MKNKWLSLNTGFALFAMFFGSGNLVFPITVGQESEGHYLFAALGIFLTGVIVPFLGVFGIMLYKGNLNSFFSSFGRKGTLLFSFLALALMGPFGVLARCITVAHGALQLLFQDISLPLTSFVMCLLILFLSVNKSRIISLLGTILTPLLLLSIAAIAFYGIKGGTFPEASIEGEGGWKALANGFFQGYQTMDLLAAFFFSSFVIQHLNLKLGSEIDEKSYINIFFKASLIGAGILSTVYLILVVLGAIYSTELQGVPPQEMLGKIAMFALGSLAAPCVCITVIFACLTTAIVLASLFADFLHKEIFQQKIDNVYALVITLGIGFSVSILDFAGIAGFLGPILEVTYPALIALTVVNIAQKYYGFRSSHWPFTLTLAAKLCTL